MSEFIEKSLEIALDAYRGQKDKAGEPYILHPLRVMEKMNTQEEKAAAILHDVIEDSDYTAKMLLERGIPSIVVDAVELLTKRPGDSYEGFIERAAKHELARVVKLADIEDNINVLRLRQLSDRDLERVEKYHRAWHRLSSQVNT